MNIKDNTDNNKKGSQYRRGMAIGAICGCLACVLIITIVFSVMFGLGQIHVGDSGQVYVENSPAGDGIGDGVINKLNAMDDVMTDFYFDDVDNSVAAEDIYKTYAEAFGDKYTIYYTAEEYKKVTESNTGKFYGIGAVCQKNEDGSVKMVTVQEGSGAEKAGIKSGDSFSKVDGKDITELDLAGAIALVKGEEGTTVQLDVTRSDGTEETITVTRGVVKSQTVAYQLQDDNIGYIYVAAFDSEDVTGEQFDAAIDDLKSQGMTSLVIDLRNNGGGLVNTAVSMLDTLVPESLMVTTVFKTGKTYQYKASDKGELDMPIAVLVNQNTASSSEIFAGALQDYGRAEIVGTQTFGKGIVQNYKTFTDGSALRYTVAKYTTPAGQDIHGVGLTPDISVDLPEDATDDYQYNAAADYLKTQVTK